VLASRGSGAFVTCKLRRAWPEECEERAGGKGLTGLAVAPGGGVVSFAAFDRALAQTLGPEPVVPAADRVLLGTRLDAELALGRELFHRVGDARISNSQMGCATCHVDGREDGLVWRLKGERRQTPMLAARLAPTAPYNWLGQSPTLEENVTQTIGRLGGSGLEEKEVRALARYIRDGLRAPALAPPRDAELVAQGERVFHDPRVGCNGCHLSDAAFTGGGANDVGMTGAHELEEMRAVEPAASAHVFDTPSLLYVGLTAPYFHDGSAATLDDVLRENRNRMGHTSQLTRKERRALVAYLESLGGSVQPLAAHQVFERLARADHR
jgi:cytochrome c peroxidase